MDDQKANQNDSHILKWMILKSKIGLEGYAVLDPDHNEG